MIKLLTIGDVMDALDDDEPLAPDYYPDPNDLNFITVAISDLDKPNQTF